MIDTSIIIPTHNRSDMVRNAIESVLALDGAVSRELVVVNDGSHDSTPNVLESYGRQIRVINTNHGERARARNQGLAAALGRYVAFLDDDDVFLPGGLNVLEVALGQADESVGAVYGRPRYFRLDPNNCMSVDLPNGIGSSGHILVDLLRNNFLVMGTVLIRRDLLIELGGFDVDYPPIEDHDLWLRLAKTAEIEYCDVEVAEIRLHHGNSLLSEEQAWRMTWAVIQANLQSASLSRAQRTEINRLWLTRLAGVIRTRGWHEFRSGHLLAAWRYYLEAIHLCPRLLLAHQTRRDVLSLAKHTLLRTRPPEMPS
jgi:glycosyltransferase involved in cell wall biosynthesis